MIPAYNAERTLGEQLEALAIQQVPFTFEVLVCDNGSTDAVSRVARDWEERLPRLRLIDASGRRGAAHARNVGAHHALAPLLVFCDADDVVGADWLAEMFSALQGAKFVAGLTEHARLNPGREWTFGWSATEPTFTVPIFPQLRAAGSGNLGIHKEVFAQVGGFDESLPHIRKRDRLRGTFRQGFAKGRGTRQLAFNYALVIKAYRGDQTAGVAATTPVATERMHGVFERVRRIPRRVLRIIRSRAQLGQDIDRIATWLGRHVGSVDATARQLPAPDEITQRSEGRS